MLYVSLYNRTKNLKHYSKVVYQFMTSYVIFFILNVFNLKEIVCIDYVFDIKEYCSTHICNCFVFASSRSACLICQSNV